MPLELTPETRSAIDELDGDLRRAAEQFGLAVLPGLSRLTPAVSGEDSRLTLTSLALDGEGEPDPLSLAACLSAHAAYVRSRKKPDGVSVGGLALARLLVWSQRAALLGPPPRVTWMGPATRTPEEYEGTLLHAECAVSVDDVTKRARAAAVVVATGPVS